MWNDTDTPLAHFISFRCYGTWLHGDERGSINRNNNVYQTPFIPSNQGWKTHNTSKLKSAPETLNSDQRRIVETAIREVCEHKKWTLHAINVRTNHIHTVVFVAADSSTSALNAFKAYSTRHLRNNGLWPHSHSPWSNKGSRRHLWNEASLLRAIDYVVNGQGGPLPDFD
jgi:REP element-mobilizing transposase RayT